MSLSVGLVMTLPFVMQNSFLAAEDEKARLISCIRLPLLGFSAVSVISRGLLLLHHHFQGSTLCTVARHAWLLHLRCKMCPAQGAT